MKRMFVLGFIFLVLGYWLGGVVQASAPLPGGPDDPVVTKSYVDKSIGESRSKLSVQLGSLQQEVESLEGQIKELKEKVRVRIVLNLGSKTAYVGNEARELEVAPFAENNRTMLPFRFIGEALGAEVLWLQGENSVVYKLQGNEVYLTIGSAVGRVNGKEITLDAAPKLVDDRTMVPVRVVGEYLGARVEWNEKLQQVTIVPGV